MEQIKYQPIDCNLYDRYLDFATRKSLIKLRFTNGEIIFEEVGFIQDISTEKKVEYLFLSNGLKIRLDQILSCDSAFE